MITSKAGAVAAAATVGLIGITGGWFAVVAPVLGAVGGYGVGKHITDAAKRHLLCRKEADDLAAALAGYVAAAIDVLRAMIARADEHSRRFGATGAASGTAGLALIQDWQQRSDEENSYRMAMIREFEGCASRLDPWLADLPGFGRATCIGMSDAAKSRSPTSQSGIRDASPH